MIDECSARRILYLLLSKRIDPQARAMGLSRRLLLPVLERIL